MSSKSEQVRRILRKNMSLPATEVVKKIAQKGISITESLVYQVRNQLKNADKESSPNVAISQPSLRSFIMDAIQSGAVTRTEIKDKVLELGYITSNRDTFEHAVAKKLRLMVEKGELSQKDDRFGSVQQAIRVGLDADTMRQVVQFCRQVGGIEQLDAYLDIIREVQNINQ